jgi:hypothetical protein
LPSAGISLRSGSVTTRARCRRRPTTAEIELRLPGGVTAVVVAGTKASVNTDRTRLAGRYGKIRDCAGSCGKTDISELGQEMRYFPDKTAFPAFRPFLNGVQEVVS